jgi:hypothetical protein
MIYMKGTAKGVQEFYDDCFRQQASTHSAVGERLSELEQNVTIPETRVLRLIREMLRIDHAARPLASVVSQRLRSIAL